MSSTLKFALAVVIVGLSVAAAGQTPSPSSMDLNSVNASPAQIATAAADVSTTPSPAYTILRDFHDSDVRFDLATLMDTLRDRRHEGWVLAAYPDPKTGKPLIGAGFSLDLPAREHQQTDPLNPHPFLEPSSADLWQAAGLEPGRLDAILDQFNHRKAAWSKKKFRKQIMTLPPDISDDDAELLLRIAGIQAIYNARAYCRNFDTLTGPQQMALAHMVYQIGINLVHFDKFLDMVNADQAGSSGLELAALENAGPDTEYWTSVQKSLMQSQWARHYSNRAITVIAMLDPRYEDSPADAEHRVSAVLRPAVAHRHRSRAGATRQVAGNTGHGKSGKKPASHSRAKRRV
jgi:GH24 family phage-related lysozyme (muramidase)